jgi:hypothetical protein
MNPSTDPEDPRDVENGTIRTESTAYQSDVDVDVEKAEGRKDGEGAIGEPDLDHEEVEQMDRGHLQDLERQHVGCPQGPHTCLDNLLPIIHVCLNIC